MTASLAMVPLEGSLRIILAGSLEVGRQSTLDAGHFVSYIARIEFATIGEIGS